MQQQQGTGGAGTQQGTGSTGATGSQQLDGVPLQRPGQGGQDLTGGVTGSGGTGGTMGPTYRGTSDEGAGTGTGGTVASGGGAGAGGSQSGDAILRELASLRERVARLERQVSAGTGGAGTSSGDTDDDTASVRAKGPIPVATAVFDGRVVDVQPKHIEIVDTSDGARYRLTIDKHTKAFMGPELKRIPVEQIPEGSTVRTSFELISSGEEHARNIVAQPVQGQSQGTPEGQTPPQ
jgi:hypothetical protein